MTFSIVARCPKTLAVGVAVATAVPAVGSRVPHAKAGIGAIATQADTNISYGVNGLKLLERGFSPQAALKAMLEEDLKRETRQVVIVDAYGRTAAFTGKETIDWKGHIDGKNFVVAGNMLANSLVIRRMAKVFENSQADLAEKLLTALEAGDTAGGDKRGKCSAALLAVDKEFEETCTIIDLQVDLHPEPVRELRRIFEESRTTQKR